jgi:hypothetical protein
MCTQRGAADLISLHFTSLIKIMNQIAGML